MQRRDPFGFGSNRRGVVQVLGERPGVQISQTGCTLCVSVCACMHAWETEECHDHFNVPL